MQQQIEQAARKIANHSQFLSDFPHDKQSVEYGALEMAKWLLSHQWISVEDELPPYEKDVFVRFVSRFPNESDKYEVGYCTRWRTKDETILTDDKSFSFIGNMEITHWMEIPTLEGGE